MRERERFMRFMREREIHERKREREIHERFMREIDS